MAINHGLISSWSASYIKLLRSKLGQMVNIVYAKVNHSLTQILTKLIDILTRSWPIRGHFPKICLSCNKDAIRRLKTHFFSSRLFHKKKTVAKNNAVLLVVKNANEDIFKIRLLPNITQTRSGIIYKTVSASGGMPRHLFVSGRFLRSTKGQTRIQKNGASLR